MLVMQLELRRRGTGRKERSLTAPIPICLITLKVCATIATISLVDRAKQLIASIPILTITARDCVRTVILIPITMQRDRINDNRLRLHFNLYY